MTVNEVLLNSISAFLDGRKIEAELAAAQWLELMRTAGEQKLLPMVFEAAGDCMPAQLRDRARVQVKRLVAGQAMRTAEFLSLYKALDESGIRPVVFKGIVCRSVYDRPDFRASSDEDIFVPPAEYPEFHEKMLELGYVCPSAPDYENAHETRYYSPSKSLIEGHWALFPKENGALDALNGLTGDMLGRTVPFAAGGASLCTLDPTDHLIFLLLHAYKHFISSGVGIRQLCDIALWSAACDIDWARVLELMRGISADRFAAAVFDAGAKFFGMEYPPLFERFSCAALVEDALGGGIYGTADATRRHSGSITLGAVEAASGERGAPVIKALFPNKAVMEMSFPWVKKSALLLPAAWSIRIAKYLFGREGGSAGDSLRIGSARTELLKAYGIIK